MRKDFPRLGLILILVLPIFTGCASINKTMQTWMGHHQSDLIASWGPPQQVIGDGQGGNIFIYSTTRTFTSPGHSTTTVTGSVYGTRNYAYGSATGYTTYTPPQTSSYNAYRMFWVDKNGYIYRWAWKGL
ncbi:MAG: hypothetical protein FJ106_02115 [Deltaproteobacteria bacterium]|nr:hypothetical protein [Deltaproteobacteria bacterium]